MTSVVVQVDGPGAREVATNTEETYADVAPSQVRDGYLHTAGETREIAYYLALLRGSVLDGQEQHHVVRDGPCERADRDRVDVFTPWLRSRTARSRPVPPGPRWRSRLAEGSHVALRARRRAGDGGHAPWWQTPLIGYSGEPGRADVDQVARWPEHEGAAKGMTLRRHHKNLDQGGAARRPRRRRGDGVVARPTRGGNDPTRGRRRTTDTREIMASSSSRGPTRRVASESSAV